MVGHRKNKEVLENIKVLGGFTVLLKKRKRKKKRGRKPEQHKSLQHSRDLVRPWEAFGRTT